MGITPVTLVYQEQPAFSPPHTADPKVTGRPPGGWRWQRAAGHSAAGARETDTTHQGAQSTDLRGPPGLAGPALVTAAPTCLSFCPLTPPSRADRHWPVRKPLPTKGGVWLNPEA